MSGGSFNYLYWKRNGDIINSISDLEEMEKWCREQDYQDAADELYQYLLLVKTCQRRMNKHADYLNELIYAIEWECSGDYKHGATKKESDKLLKGNEE